MGLMDKFKNLFTDEEIIEDDMNDPIEIKEVKKEEEVHKLPTFMRERIDKEEKSRNDDIEIDIDFKKELKLDSLMDREESEEEKSSFKFPLEFNDDDFIETRSRHKMHSVEVMEEPEMPKKEILKEKPKKEISEVKVKDLYKENKVEEKKFKATPIISPIYGILDKNYSSSDVESNQGRNLADKRHSKTVDFDSVRKKAYGDLTKEIKENLMCENCEYLKEAKECKKNKEKEIENNMVYEVLNETEEDYDYYSNITLDEATENYYDYGVEYEKNLVSPEDSEVMINNSEEEFERPVKKEIPPVKSSINLLSTLKKSMGEEEQKEKLELTDDLFNLIDSMYDERDEK